jgi:hypothetical protein
LRLNLAREHLDRAEPVDDLVDPKEAFTAFADPPRGYCFGMTAGAGARARRAGCAR